jgi:hypothetical protein
MTDRTTEQEMVLVATHWRGHEASRRRVKVKVSPKRYRIIEGLHKGEQFDRLTGASVAAFNPFSMYRYKLEKVT